LNFDLEHKQNKKRNKKGMIAMELCETSIPALTTLPGNGCLPWFDDIHENLSDNRRINSETKL
jgi:hypothetical protein